MGIITDDFMIEQGYVDDVVHHPSHYTSHPSGIECIDISMHMNFPLGSAIKYIWRAGLKDDATLDLKKAKEYINIELRRLESINKPLENMVLEDR